MHSTTGFFFRLALLTAKGFSAMPAAPSSNKASQNRIRAAGVKAASLYASLVPRGSRSAPGTAVTSKIMTSMLKVEAFCK